MKRSSKIILTSCLAFLLVGLIGISILTTNKGVKAEILQDRKKYTLNIVNNFNFDAYNLANGERWLDDIDSNAIVFQIKTNDVYDDLLQFNRFGLKIGKTSTAYYIRVMPYINSSGTFGSGNQLYYQLVNGLYKMDIKGALDDDPDYWEIIIECLTNAGFYIVEGLPLPDNQISSDDVEYNSPMYYARQDGSLLNTDYRQGDGYAAGFDEGATSEYNKIIGNPTLYGLYPENTVRQNYYNGYTAGLNASSNAFSRFGDILRTSWNSAANILNTQVFGPLTILHLISIPILLGLFLIVLKLIRG